MSAAAAVAIDSPRSRRGFTQAPHDYWDVLHRKVSGLPQYWAIGYIMRETLGKERGKGEPAPEWTEPTSYRTFARKGGFCERQAESILADAIKRRLIERRKDPREREYRYKALPEQWPSARPYEMPARKPVEVETDAHPGKGEVKAKDGRSPLRSSTPQKQQEPMVLMPGADSKPIPLAQAVRASIRNEASSPVSIHTSQDKGVFQVCVRDGPDADIVRTCALTRSNDPSSPLRPSADTAVDSKRLSEIQLFLQGTWHQLFGKPLEKGIVQDLGRELADTPLEWYRRTLADRIKRGGMSPRLFVLVAKESRAGYQEWASAQISRPSAGRDWEAEAAAWNEAVEARDQKLDALPPDQFRALWAQGKAALVRECPSIARNTSDEAIERLHEGPIRRYMAELLEGPQ